MSKKDTPLAEAILRLRTELGMKQAEFAATLEITPTSVYRYESSASKPDQKILEKLWAIAAEHGSKSAEVAFFNAMREQFGRAGAVMTYEPAPVYEVRRWLLHAALETGKWLSEEQTLLLLAFCKMLLSSRAEKTAQEVIKTILKPWIEEARVSRENYLKQTGRKTEIETERKANKRKKPRARKPSR